MNESATFQWANSLRGMKRDLKEARSETLAHQKFPAQKKAMIDEFDKDQDGMINQEEFGSTHSWHVLCSIS